MKWKVLVQGDKPSVESAQVLTERTGLPVDEILEAFSHEDSIECSGLTEGEAQKIADSLRRDPGIQCRILPDQEEEAQPAGAQRVAHLHRVPLHLHRVKVVEHAVHDHVGAIPRAVGVALPEDRSGPEDRRPRLGSLDRVAQFGRLLLGPLG